MKKILIAAGICLMWTLCASVLTSCGSNGSNRESSGDESNGSASTEISEEAVTQPEEVKVIIDRSGSMKGYFNPKDMQAMMQALEDLRRLGKVEGSVQFCGDTKPFSGSKAANILAASKFDKDTDMGSLLKECVNLGGDSIPVALITDGIVSTSLGKNNLPQIEGDLKDILENKNQDLAWILFRGETPYDGAYYIEANRPKAYPKVNLKVEERPFYIVVVGPKPQIRYIVEQAEANEEKWDKNWDCEMMSFNTHDNHSGLQFYADDDTYFKEAEDGKTYIFHNKQQNDKIPLIFNCPSCLTERAKKLKPSNATLNLNGTNLKGWTAQLSGSGKDKYVQIDIPGDELILNGNNENVLTLSFNAMPEDEWTKEYSSSDDSAIMTDSEEQERTYQLASLIEPMTSASTNNDVTVTFKYVEK